MYIYVTAGSRDVARTFGPYVIEERITGRIIDVMAEPRAMKTVRAEGVPRELRRYVPIRAGHATVNDIIEAARLRGYDGVRFRNMRDSFNDSLGPTDIYATWGHRKRALASPNEGPPRKPIFPGRGNR